VIEINWVCGVFPTLDIAAPSATSKAPHMQVIPIIWPILLCAFLTGMLFAWVWFVALPRLRRADRNARVLRTIFSKARRPPPASESHLVDKDQQGARRNL
jgi:hypothetical protein